MIFGVAKAILWSGDNSNNNVIMVINREFFFRGWLPAGLLINARLVMNSSEHGEMVLRPVLNPSQKSSWPDQQPPIVFPVSQATDNKAILLKDGISEGTIAMLPLGDWYGPGTPYILAINTWYEGRIQEVSGGDVMAIRISKAFTLSYYSQSGVAEPDVRLATFPCRWIRGIEGEKRAFRDTSSLLDEIGYVPNITEGGKDVPLPVLDILKLRTIHLAGMRVARPQSSSPTNSLHYVQCEIVSGLQSPDPKVKYYGVVGTAEPNVQNFYSVNGDEIGQKIVGIDIIRTRTIGALSVTTDDEQVIHYN